MSPFHAARPTEGITERNSVFTDVPISRGAPRGRNNGQERFFTGSPISRGAPREKAVRAGHAAGRVKRAPILRRAPRREQPCPRRAAAGAPPEQPPPMTPRRPARRRHRKSASPCCQGEADLISDRKKDRRRAGGSGRRTALFISRAFRAG